MLTNIFLHLNESDLKSVRLTCKKWCDFINDVIPVNLMLDDRQLGNPAFVKKMVKKEVLINSATKAGAEKALNYPKNPNALRKMVCTLGALNFLILIVLYCFNQVILGQVHGKYFIQEMLNFQNLETLIIGGITLLKRLNLKQSIYLPNLQTLV
jgi:hypothetical protein